MKFLVTNYLDEKEKRKLQKKGLFCYDLRGSDLGCDIATIENNVFVNRVGSMITNEKINLGDKLPNDFIDYETFVANNEQVDTLKELVNNTKIKNKEKIL